MVHKIAIYEPALYPYPYIAHVKNVLLFHIIINVVIKFDDVIYMMMLALFSSFLKLFYGTPACNRLLYSIV